MRAASLPRFLLGSSLSLYLSLLAVACASAGGTSPAEEASAGGTTAAGSSGAGGTTAGAGGGGAGGQSGEAGEAGAGGSDEAGAGGEAGAEPDGGINVQGGAGGSEEDGGLQDAKPDVDNDSGCVGDPPKGPGPLPHVCAVSTGDECDGNSDINPQLPNGPHGNGFDDDCDGVVDEGCSCDPDHPVGTTRECFLVPSSQASPDTNQPVGWCQQNSRGTMACIKQGGGELAALTWDGFCKGAQFPFADDVCAPGDYNCDGQDSNSETEECGCNEVEVTCPTEVIVTSPYPDPTNLEKKKPNPFDPNPNDPFVLDGYKWITKGDPATATSDWWWSITGGDCDNILPHVTFAAYNGPNTKQAKSVGVELGGLGTNGKQKGILTDPAQNHHIIWPAFALSGDYVASGAFKANGKDYFCTVKVQVRAPGLRAEMCWDMKGDPFLGLSSSDVDLHLARQQGAKTCGKDLNGDPGQHGWFKSCGAAPTSDDCFFTCDSGCRTGNQGFCLGNPAPAPGWGYKPSDASACHGWGSLREQQQSCDNPRLDRDNLGCNTNIVDPNTPPSFLDNGLSNYCGPENINLDNPNPGDAFLVGAHFFSGDVVHPHINIYCNGERKLALGYDPTTEPQSLFPTMNKGFNPGQSASFYAGDFWQAARITWNGDEGDPCRIEPIGSTKPKASKDGSNNICVDTNAQNKASPTASDAWLFTPEGGYPDKTAEPSSLCWH